MVSLLERVRVTLRPLPPRLDEAEYLQQGPPAAARTPPATRLPPAAEEKRLEELQELRLEAGRAAACERPETGATADEGGSTHGAGEERDDEPTPTPPLEAAHAAKGGAVVLSAEALAEARRRGRERAQEKARARVREGRT